MAKGDRDTGHFDTQSKNKKAQTKGPKNKLQKEDLSSSDGPSSSYEKGKIKRNESQGKLVGGKKELSKLVQKGRKKGRLSQLV